MHRILSLLKHVSRKNEGRRVETEDPAPRGAPDHPLEREKDGHGGCWRVWFRGSQSGGLAVLGKLPLPKRREEKFTWAEIIARADSLQSLKPRFHPLSPAVCLPHLHAFVEAVSAQSYRNALSDELSLLSKNWPFSTNDQTRKTREYTKSKAKEGLMRKMTVWCKAYGHLKSPPVTPHWGTFVLCVHGVALNMLLIWWSLRLYKTLFPPNLHNLDRTI